MSDQLWWYNIERFLSYFKIYICKFMQANSWHKLFHFRLSFWICNAWKGKKLQRFEYLENEKSFLDEIKKKNHIFWRAIIWRKKKLIKKIAVTSFKEVNFSSVFLEISRMGKFIYIHADFHLWSEWKTRTELKPIVNLL